MHNNMLERKLSRNARELLQYWSTDLLNYLQGLYLYILHKPSQQSLNFESFSEVCQSENTTHITEHGNLLHLVFSFNYIFNEL